jgi:ribosomal protein S18
LRRCAPTPSSAPTPSRGGAPQPAQGDWKDYLTIEGGSSVGGPAMRADLDTLTQYTADADKFITQRQTELNDRMQRTAIRTARIARNSSS